MTKPTGFDALVASTKAAVQYGLTTNELHEISATICAEFLLMAVQYTDNPRVLLFSLANLYLNLSDAFSNAPYAERMKTAVEYIKKLASSYDGPNQKLREFFETPDKTK